MPSPDRALRSIAAGLQVRRLTGASRAPMLLGEGSLWRRRRTPLFHYVAVVEGRLSCCIGAGPSRVRGPGAALLIPPGAVHDLGRRDGHGIIAWADFTIDCWGAIPIAELMDFPLDPAPAPLRTIGQHLEALLDPAGGRDAAVLLASLCRHHGALLAEVLALGRWRSEAAGRIDVLLRLAPLLSDIADRLAEPWPRERMAAVIGLAVTRLNQVFHAATGRSPAAFVRRLRLARSAELLLTSALPLAAIAAQTGFVDAFHLSRAFTAERGLAPSHYRRRFRHHLPPP